MLSRFLCGSDYVPQRKSHSTSRGASLPMPVKKNGQKRRASSPSFKYQELILDPSLGVKKRTQACPSQSNERKRRRQDEDDIFLLPQGLPSHTAGSSLKHNAILGFMSSESPSYCVSPSKRQRRENISRDELSPDDCVLAVEPLHGVQRDCTPNESTSRTKRRRARRTDRDVTTPQPEPRVPRSAKSTPRPVVVVPADQPVIFPSQFVPSVPYNVSVSAIVDERTEDLHEDEPFNPRWQLAVNLIASQPPLVQLRVCHDPWRVLVATLMLNKTNGKYSLPIFWDLMTRWPTAADMQYAPLEELVQLLRPLGFQNFRSRRLIELSASYIARPPDLRVLHRSRVVGGPYPPTAVSHLPGAGRYALDSYRMFCLPGDEWRSVSPRDKELVRWMEWRWASDGLKWCPERGVVGPLDDEGYVAVIIRCGKPHLASIPELRIS